MEELVGLILAIGFLIFAFRLAYSVPLVSKIFKMLKGGIIKVIKKIIQNRGS